MTIRDKAMEGLGGPTPKPEKWRIVDCDDTELVATLDDCETKGYEPFQVLPIREDVQAAMPQERFRVIARWRGLGAAQHQQQSGHDDRECQ